MALFSTNNLYGATAPNQSAYVGMYKLTVMCWVNTGFEGGSWRRIFKIDEAWEFSEYSGDALNHMRWRQWADDEDHPISTTAFAEGTWHHVAGVFDGSVADNRYSGIVVDGVIEDERTHSGAAVAIPSVSNDVGIMADPTGSNSVRNSYVADLRIYNDRLSLDAIKTIVAAEGQDEILDGLVARWLCDDGYPGQVLGSGELKDMTNLQNHGGPCPSDFPQWAAQPFGLRRRVA